MFERYVGVDITSKDSTAALTLPGAKPKPFLQTPAGFQQFIERLLAQGLPATSQ